MSSCCSAWGAGAVCLVLAMLSACNDDTSTPQPGKLVVPKGALLAMSDAAHDTTPDASDSEVKSLGADNRAFAFALWDELAKKPGNLFCSPYSISTALAMTYAGARGNTAAEMKSALHFNAEQAKLHAAFNATSLALTGRKDELEKDTAGDGFELDVVNQAWGDKQMHFEASYLDILAINYGAGLFLVDFAGDPNGARTIINGWVADKTHDRIAMLIPEGSIDNATSLVLTNAVYFKASWLSKFDPQKTDSAAFHAAGGDQQAKMMHQGLEAHYAESADYQAVDLPYVSKSVRMLVVMPAQDRFEAVSGALGATFDDARQHLASYYVTLSMPKVSFKSKPPLVAPLMALGMKDAFTSDADFSGIDGARDLFIQDVVHEAFVAVDENGTEAAAATAVIIGKASAPQAATLTLDRPFFFFVYDEPTGELLFMGRVMDPTAS